MSPSERLLRALGGAHTRKTWLRRVAGLLADEAGLAGLDVSWTTGPRRVETDRVLPGTETERLEGELEEGLGTAAMRTGAPVWSPVLNRGPDSADERTAADMGAVRFAALPLQVRGHQGFALLFFSRRRKPDLPWALLTELLSVAEQKYRLVERLAAGSRRAVRENKRLRAEIQEWTLGTRLVARSPGMRKLLDQVRLVAGHDTTVLLQGESGVGKEVLARHVHALSTRARGPFVAVNCGALPESLVESELFGHEPGAFTGATRSHSGRFRRAHRGTLFLDEIGELSPAAQVKLLRVLQDGVVEPLGAQRATAVDVRLIAATNRPLRRAVAAGSFREDLYYRLDVFPLTVPPLRERKEDLPELVSTLLEEIAERLGGELKQLDAASSALLQERAWPGNVRQLRNVLERAYILSPGTTLALPEPNEEAADGSGGAPASETFREAVTRCLESALTATRGRIYGPGGAAERLGLKPTTLQSKLRRLGLEPADYRTGA